MFQFPGFASMHYVFMHRSPCGGVAPFGHSRIKACSRLPMTFRSVPRPSSPPDAKASTECSYRALSRRVRQHPTPCTEAKHARTTPSLATDYCPRIRPVRALHVLYSTQHLNASDRIRCGLGAMLAHGHPVRLADRSTPRGAPEPDLQLKDQHHPIARNRSHAPCRDEQTPPTRPTVWSPIRDARTHSLLRRTTP